MKTINDIIEMINENSFCADCKRECPFILGIFCSVWHMGFCGLDATQIALEYLERGEY